MEYKKITKEKWVETLATIALGFLIIGFLYKDEKYPSWALFIIFFSLIFGLFVPIVAKPVSWLWYKLSDVLGFVMSKVILGIVFYLFLTPFALLYRLSHSDSFNLKGKKESYFSHRELEYSDKDLENPW